MSSARTRVGVCALVALVTVAVVVYRINGKVSDTGEHARPAPPLTESAPAPVTTTAPDARTTGPRPGRALTPSGSIRVDTEGAVIADRVVTGTITVAANDVHIVDTVVRSTERYPIRILPDAHGVVIDHVEIDGLGRGFAAVCCSNYALRHSDIHDVTEGPQLGSNTVVEYSYLHDLRPCRGCHVDALQSIGGSHILVRGNNIQALSDDGQFLANAAYQFGEERAPLTDVLVEGNLLNGGNYTVNGGGGGTTDARVTFRDNRFQRDSRYGPIAHLGPFVRFDATNVWDDTGRPVTV